MYPHIKTSESLTVIVNDYPHSITSDNTNYEEILNIVRRSEVTSSVSEKLLELIKPIVQFERILSQGCGTEFCIYADTVSCSIDGVDFPIDKRLNKEILEVFKSYGDLAPLYKFVTKLAKNPRKEVIDELWGFIASCGLALTKEGNFLAYKNVNVDFTDVYTGSMDNSPGSVVEEPRFSVEHDPNKTCAKGLHFAAWGYLKHYAPGRKTVILSINPKNVVSIPTDYNNMKGRACKYKVLREVSRDDELSTISVDM